MSATITAPPAPLAPASGRAPIVRLTWLLARPGAQSGTALALPAVAFAVVTALLLTVVGGTLMFWRWEPDEAGLTATYQTLSLLALALLAIPLVSLGGAAARLSARRRDDRLASLRLLGATPAAVAAMTVLESAGVALVGALAGTLLYAALMPLVGLVPFGGGPIGAAALWVGAPVLVAVLAGVVLVASVSAAVGLRRVIVTPLGVRTRQDAPRMHWLRALVAVVVVAAGVVVLSLPGFGAGLVIVVAMFAAALAVLNAVGPWAIGVHARLRVRRAATAPRLIAARTVLESPKAAWRQISGIALTTFVAVIGGVGMALAGAASADDSSATMAADIRTGVLVTLVVSFLMVACSVGVNQASAILDRRGLYVGLDRIGMPRRALEEARTRATMGPLLFTVVISALSAGVLAFPLVGIALILAPASILVISACLAGGVALVWLSLRATRPVLTRVLAEPERAE